MSIVFILVPLSIVLVALAAGAFIWAVNADQFEDLDRASWDALHEERGSDGQK